MRILTGLSIISRCTLARQCPHRLATFSCPRIESLHTSPVLGIFQRKRWNEERIRNMDKLPEEYRLIYRNPMYNYVSIVTYITSGSFLVIGSFIAHRLITGEFSFDPELIEASEVGPLTSSLTEVYVMGFFFVVMNVILRITLNRFPLRIYRSGEKYLSIYTWKLPFKPVIVEFSKGDCVKSPARGILWKEARYKIRGQKNILLYEYFKAPADLHTMMERPKEK